ncbi:MAG: hypothetical protein ABSH02_08970 [Candidatus Sulfotelmatobacter sp.]
MRTPTTIRLTMALLIAGILVLALPQRVRAQDDPNEAPLGDVARSFRKKVASPEEVIIDNDNFSKVVEDAESRRASGSTMVFSLDPGAKNFQVSSPDVSCSFSFSAKTSSLLSDPIALDELPRSELAKLDGPATIDGDSLQVSMHNGTAWELREVVIGLTILRRPAAGDTTASYGTARIVPAVADGSAKPVQDSLQKQPDITVLLRVKGSAAPSTTALFRTQLNFALFPDQEWHWAIVRAKGVPPQPPAETTTQLDQVPGQLPVPPTLTDPGPQAAPSTPAPPNPDAPVH